MQKEDPLGNKLWEADGTPQWTTIFVDKPVQGANVTFTQAPQPDPPIANPPPQFSGRGGGRGGVGRGGRGRGGSSRGRKNGNNGGQSG